MSYQTPIVFIDFETYYDAECSLKRLTPLEFIRHPKFAVHGCAIKMGLGGATTWCNGPVTGYILRRIAETRTTIVSHNALFDMAVVYYHYGIRFLPGCIGDTLAVARAALPQNQLSFSLGEVAKALGATGKIEGVLPNVKGMTMEQIKDAGLEEAYSRYAVWDTELCAYIWRRLVVEGGFPSDELKTIDMVTRAAVDPQLRINTEPLHRGLNAIEKRRTELLHKLSDVTPEALRSTRKFQSLLEEEGVRTPYKDSPTSGLRIPALAKSDPDFVALRSHEKERVRDLVEARLAFKSNMEQTRIEKFLTLAACDPAHVLPVPLNYSGAHTHRLSGAWGLNLQNLPRGSVLREAIVAPPGKMVMAVDLSQIEARIVAWLAGQNDLLGMFARNEDVYSEFGTKLFGYPVSKSKTPVERHIAKTAVLGCGYGMGSDKFLATIHATTDIDMDIQRAAQIVSAYRRINYNIRLLWDRLGSIGIGALIGYNKPWELGPVHIEKERIRLPSGLYLRYNGIKMDLEGAACRFGRTYGKVYGGRLTENITQALARDLLMEASRKLWRFAMQVHDELVFVVDERAVEHVAANVKDILTTPPDWAKGLPLACDISWGKSYADAK